MVLMPTNGPPECPECRYSPTWINSRSGTAISDGGPMPMITLAVDAPVTPQGWPVQCQHPFPWLKTLRMA